MSADQQLAVVPPQETALSVYSTPNGLEPWLQTVRAEVDAFNRVLPELTTAKGRQQYASMAHKIAKTKNALETMGKQISAEQKEIPKKIDAERKRVWDTLEAWQKEVRKPLDDWQATEDKRTAAHTDSIQRIKDMVLFAETPAAAAVAKIIVDLELIALDDSWEEFLAKAAQAKDQTLAKLRSLHTERARHEAEQVELVRLRAEAEAQAQRDRDAQIAREAEERATAKAAADAQAERDAAAKREQDLIDQAAARQRESEQAAREAEAAAERQRRQLQLQTEQAHLAAEQAEINRLAAEQRAEQRAEQQRLDAIQHQAQAVEQARQDEIRRQNEAKAEEERQAKAREADKTHKTKINRAALDAFIAGGMPDECARQAVTLIAQRKIPAIAITY